MRVAPCLPCHLPRRVDWLKAALWLGFVLSSLAFWFWVVVKMGWL